MAAAKFEDTFIIIILEVLALVVGRSVVSRTSPARMAVMPSMSLLSGHNIKA